MKAKRKGDAVTVKLATWERAVLTNLLPQLRELVVLGDSPYTRRLYPTAYPADEQADAAYRELVHDQLLAGHLAAIEVVESGMDGDSIVLDDAGTTRWLQALNSLRLVLGTRLDVSEEHHPDDLDPDDPDLGLWQAYYILSEMLSDLLDALTR